MACGYYWDGTAWVQPTQVHVWDGTAWVQAVEAYVFDGTAWTRFFPCSGGNLAITLSENSLLLDRYTLVKVSRDTVKGPFVELLSASESAIVKRKITLSENALLLDRHVLVKINRDTVKGPFVELIKGSETGSIFKRKKYTASETANILDRHVLVKVNRDINKKFVELVKGSETGTISITDLPPIISACSIAVADRDDPNFKVRCRFDTGNYCESVIIERNVAGAGFVFHQNMNTTPNTNTNLSAYHTGTCEQTIEFKIRPFKGDGQTGTEGTSCTTNLVVIGGVGSCV